MANAKHDQNHVPTLIGVSSVDGSTPINAYVDPVTHRLLVDSANGSGTVTSVSVVTANGISGSVADPTTTPAITLTLGDITPTTVTTNSVQALGVSSGLLLKNNAGTTVASFGVGGASSTSISLVGATVVTGNISATNLSGTNTGDQTSVSGNAGTATALATPRAIYGNNFDGTAALTQIIASTYGGTGNGFTKFSGPTTSEKTFTLPDANATIARTDAAQTFTGTQTFSQIVTTSNAITASGNAATVPITSRISTVTNNSAATLTITITTTSAVDGQMVMVRVLDFSAVAQTITWVNTENSTVSAPTTSNGSTTLPLTVGFQYNANTSKWRCIATA